MTSFICKSVGADPLNWPICGAVPAVAVTVGNTVDDVGEPVIESTPPSVEQADNRSNPENRIGKNLSLFKGFLITPNPINNCAFR